MIESTFYLESQSNSKEALEISVKKLLEEVKALSNVKVTRQMFHEILEDEDEMGRIFYSSVVEVDIKTNFREYINLCMRLVPSTIEIISGDVKIKGKELLEIFGDVSSTVNKLCKKYNLTLYRVGETEGVKQEEIGIDEEDIEDAIGQGGALFKFVVEARAKNEKFAMEKTKELVNDTGALVNKMIAKKVGEGEAWEGVVGMEALFPDIETLFDAVIKFSPVAMSVIEPEVVHLNMAELQNIGIDIAGIIQQLTFDVITKGMKTGQGSFRATQA
ncbi:MAG: hypothetical protein KO464_06615 [Candidatus Methanofastidiosum sp.]|nr:hypothetical protein [Methanofastidiosum sp.]